MSGTTVIDQLIVRLGLDPRDFTKGEREAAASIRKTEQDVKQSSQSMGQSFAGLATKFLGVAALIDVAKKIAGSISDLSTSTRQLGIDSRNYGVAASELRNLQNASEMFGGTADAVTKSVGGFQKAIFDLAFNGQISDSLTMLARLGVQFQNTDGSARDFKDVLLDTAGALESSGLSKAQQYQFARSAGLDEGSAQVALLGRAGAETELARQGKRTQVTDTILNAATAIEQSATNRDQSVQAGALKILPIEAPAHVRANDALAATADALSGQHGLSQAADAASAALGRVVHSILGGDVTHDTGNVAHRGSSGFARGLFGSALNSRNNNPLNLKAVGDQVRDARGFRVFDTLEDGIQAANKQISLDESRGTNTIRKLINKLSPASDGNNVQAYIDDVVKQTTIGADEPFSEGDHALLISALAKHEGIRGLDVGTVADVLTPIDDSPPTPGALAGAGGGSQTDIQIDSITVNTQATDAEGIAGDIRGALNRKFTSAQAEQGQQ